MQSLLALMRVFLLAALVTLMARIPLMVARPAHTLQHRLQACPAETRVSISRLECYRCIDNRLR
jgi:hypothetical protein